MKINYPITSKFLQQESFRQKPHSGLDFDMKMNEPLRSIKDGTIYKVVDFGDVNAGKTVMVKWNDGKIAIYGHLNKFGNIKQGDHVAKGDLIGYAGNSGHVVSSTGDGTHLHFGIKEGGKFIDPTPYQDLIQQMNDPTFIAKVADKPTEKLFSISKLFTNNSSVNSDILHLFKSNFIQFIGESKTFFISLLSSVDYSMFIQHVQDVLKLLS